MEQYLDDQLTLMMVLRMGWRMLLYNVLWVDDGSVLEISLDIINGIVNGVDSSDVLDTIKVSSYSVSLGSTDGLVFI